MPKTDRTLKGDELEDLIFLGIDQTGAVDRLGKPKPLPVCLIQGNSIRFQTIAKFSLNEIESLVGFERLGSVVVCIDCVLGLPAPFGKTLQQAMDDTARFPGFGRKVAQKYFSELLSEFQILQGPRGLNNKLDFPRRKVELLTGSNSVFQVHPFQKNIQTGTFRFWKDMVDEKHPYKFVFPMVNKRFKRGNTIPVYEGYPSLSWKILFQTTFRRPTGLPLLLKRHFGHLKISREDLKTGVTNPNFADSMVLALTATCFWKAAQEFSAQKEGWILGFEMERNGRLGK